jgi:hypothetical protein
MGILCPIVQPFVLAVLDAGQHLLFSSTVARKFIRNQHARDILTPIEELAKELLGGSCVPPALNQDIEHRATPWR